MAYHLKLVLKSGKDNIRLFPKTATTGIWTQGDLVTLSSGKVVPIDTAGSDGSDDIETAILGVAMSTEALDASAETNNVQVSVSVVTPEQVWSVHVADGAIATDYTIGAGYKFNYYGAAVGSEKDYNVGTDGGTDTIEVNDCYILSTTAQSADAKGATVVGYPYKGVGEDIDYGGRVLIRFNPLACLGITG